MVLNGGDSSVTESNTKSGSQALIIRDIPQDVFTEDKVKKEFETLFVSFRPVHFTYLPGFQRIIANFENGETAVRAKAALNEKKIKGCEMKIFLKEEAKVLGEPFLKLPKAEKLFLISPPASPPVGWEQVQEDPPVVNYELISAVAKLEVPGKPVELVSKTENTPSIIVVGCEDVDYGGKPMKSMKSLAREEVQTKRPPVK